MFELNIYKGKSLRKIVSFINRTLPEILKKLTIYNRIAVDGKHEEIGLKR